MGCVWVYALMLTLILLGVAGENNNRASDFITRLPGQPQVNFAQYAGYIDISNGKALFYYFVEAVYKPEEKPLALWLNGGPGCSSIGDGAFTEVGPFQPNINGTGLLKNPYSWNKMSNLLFVESPAGVGWSYSYIHTVIGDEITAMDMFTFMLKWLEIFSEFKSRELLLCGESYAGHYIPQLAMKMLEHNAHSKGFKFNLIRILLGNPLLRSYSDIGTEVEFLWSHGLISDKAFNSVKKHCRRKDFLFAYNNSAQCDLAINEANRNTGSYTNSYDIIHDICYPSPMKQENRLGKKASRKNLGADVCIDLQVDVYFNLPRVQKALHANTTSLPYKWTKCNLSIVETYNLVDRDTDILPLLYKMLQNNVHVLAYSGDQDSRVPFSSTRRLISELADNLKFKVTRAYGPWFAGSQVAGWTAGYENLTFATVKAAGHKVPFNQGKRALQLFSSFVGGEELPDKPF